MGVLLTTLKWIAGIIIPPIISKLGSMAMKWVAQWIAKGQIEKKNKEAREKTENANTPEERDAAAKNIISKF